MAAARPQARRRVGYPNRGPCATTKWGLVGFAKTLSRIAALAVFLASDAARSISGQAISIDTDSQSAS